MRRYLSEANRVSPQHIFLHQDERFSLEVNHESSPESYPIHHDDKKIVYDE